ncbi:hypothetical protein D3C80_1018780 [compost metagenome]
MAHHGEKAAFDPQCHLCCILQLSEHDIGRLQLLCFELQLLAGLEHADEAVNLALQHQRMERLGQVIYSSGRVGHHIILQLRGKRGQKDDRNIF